MIGWVIVFVPIALVGTIVLLLAHIERLRVEIRDGRSAWCIERFRCQALEREIAAEREIDAVCRMREGPYR